MRRVRRKIRIRGYKAAVLFRRAAAILTAGLLVRLLFVSGLAGKAEQRLRAAGSDPDAARTILSFEVPCIGSGSVSALSWQWLLAGQSAVFSGFGGAVETLAGPEQETDFKLPPLSEPAPEPTASSAAPEPTPAASAAPSPLPAAQKKNIKTITISPNSPGGYDYFNGVYIKNQTNFTIDVETALKNEPSVKLAPKGAQVLVIHTHGSEAYHPEGEDTHVPSDTDRTEDKNFSVIRVGDEIVKILEAKGLTVVHDTNLYDYPSYAGCYSRALEAIAVHLKKNPTIQVVIDVHRDSMVASDNSIYKTVANINGVQAAQVMLVMGTGQSGLSFPNWKDNLRLAVRVQKQMADKYPGLARPINLRKERFNEHATPGSMLVEVGTTGNSLQEALEGARLFADACGDVLLRYRK